MWFLVDSDPSHSFPRPNQRSGKRKCEFESERLFFFFSLATSEIIVIVNSRIFYACKLGDFGTLLSPLAFIA